MTVLEQAVERAVEDIIVALISGEAEHHGRWLRLEVAANRLRKAVRELQRNTLREPAQ